jgi:hypothetical protein
MAEQPVNLSTAIYLGVFSRAEQRVLQAIFKAIAEGGGRCLATLAMLARAFRRKQVNHAQCDQPGGRNRPSGKDRTPLLLRCLASQHSDLREALMVSHNVAFGVARLDCPVFRPDEPWQTLEGRTIWADWQRAQNTIGALCPTRLGLSDRLCMNRLAGNGAEVGSQWSERRRWDSSGPKFL